MEDSEDICEEEDSVMQGEEEEEDPFDSLDEDSLEGSYQQGGQEVREDSVVQDTCMSASNGVNESEMKDGVYWDSTKVNNETVDPKFQKMDVPPTNDPTGQGPHNSPIEEKDKDTYEPVNNKSNTETHLATENDEIGESPLYRKGISGKLKILLSKNIPISDKLVEEKEISTNRRSGDLTKSGEVMDRSTHQVEPRITRSQSRLFLKEDKGITRASSRSFSSENTETSFNVIQRMEEVGASCGLSKGKKERQTRRSVVKMECCQIWNVTGNKIWEKHLKSLLKKVVR
ncbi:hypothetical protein L1887_24142 [Cichorium endivia]|nr:hypothetical protein L1887_24142 [Cichorium endivia]